MIVLKLLLRSWNLIEAFSLETRYQFADYNLFCYVLNWRASECARFKTCGLGQQVSVLMFSQE